MKFRLSVFWAFSILLALTLFNCNKDDDDAIIEEQMEEQIPLEANFSITVNPSGHAPLTAKVVLTTNFPTKASMRVLGKHGPNSDVGYEQTTPSQYFHFDVLGLYPDYINQIQFTFYNAAGKVLKVDTINLQTAPLHENMPEITIEKAAIESIKPGFNLVNYFGFNSDPFPQTAFAFDAYGDIRWYLDFSGHPELGGLFYDVGMILLQNGNLAFGDKNSDKIYEVDYFGEVLGRWHMDGYAFHHTIYEKPNGNFLATVSDNQLETYEDIIIEIDRNTDAIVKVWNLNESLQNTRNPWGNNTNDIADDWSHANGLAYDAEDNAIIVSLRSQGVAKLSNNNEVIWIMAHHKNWETAGNGVSLNAFLLRPLDSQGSPIEEQGILEGYYNHASFEWNWFQHAPRLLPNGHIMVFDNGDFRNFGAASSYSRAVVYDIDETNKTIQQIWAYGKENGESTYSSIVSGVEYFEEENNVLFAPGAIVNPEITGKILEVDYPGKAVLFEATIKPPRAFGTIVFHNIKRIDFYRDK